MSILSFLKDYAAKNPSRWHTPGHKGSLNPLDITELCDGTFPEGLIGAAEKKASGLYGAKHLRFLTNGSSMGIKAAILAAGGDILAPASCHCSIPEGAELAGVDLYLFDPGHTDGGLPAVPSLDGVEAALKKHGCVKAVILESPDYYGRVVDPAIPELIRKSGKYFFCDAAHGAHFPAHPELFPKSYSAVADACNLSAHKTLDAYTQSAYLCVNHGELIGKIDGALKNLGTTSPSYLLFASLESAIETARKNQGAYERLYKDAEAFKQKIRCLKNDDFTRICVDAGSYGLTGEELANRLAAGNIFAERAEGAYTVFIATPHETSEDFERLAMAVQTIVKGKR